MKNRDWEFVVIESLLDTPTYYAQHKIRHMPREQILQSDLTKTQAMALLSLIGTPQKYRNDSYFVHIENNGQ
jgi:hypothetical protein